MLFLIAAIFLLKQIKRSKNSKSVAMADYQLVGKFMIID